MEHIAFEYLDPLQKAQIAHLRPDIYNRIKDEIDENQMDEQRLNEREGDRNDNNLCN